MTDHEVSPALIPEELPDARIGHSSIPSWRHGRKLDSLRESQPFLPRYIGMINPYLGAPIRTEQDYDEYLSMHALVLLCGSILEQEKEDLNCSIKNDLLTLEGSKDVAWSYVERREKDLRRMRLIFFLVLGLILVYTSVLIYLAWTR